MNYFHRKSTGDSRDIISSVEMIRSALAAENVIEFRCYNAQEVNEIKRLLTESEINRIRFTWIFPRSRK